MAKILHLSETDNNQFINEYYIDLCEISCVKIIYKIQRDENGRRKKIFSAIHITVKNRIITLNDKEQAKKLIKGLKSLPFNKGVRIFGDKLMPERNNMTKKEKSLLLFFETCEVDWNGKIDTQYMNDEEFKLAKKWSDEGFISFGRIPFAHIKRSRTHWVKLSDEAWELAHIERRAKADRMGRSSYPTGKRNSRN